MSNRTKQQPKKRTKASARKKLSYNTKIGNIAALALTAVIALCTLLYNADYLRKIEGLDMFSATAMYFADCMRAPGGLITWCGSMLTQTLHWPWLGALIYTALLIASWLLAAKAVKLPWRYLPIASIIPAMILVGLMRLGYIIFSIKAPGHAFAMPLGVICACALAWGYRLIPQWYLRVLAIAVIVAVGYPSLGVFALLAVGLAVCTDLTDLGKRGWLHLVPIVVGLLGAWLLPKYLFTHISSDISAEQIYLAPLPRLQEGEGDVALPVWVIFISLPVLALLRRCWKPDSRWSLYTALAVQIFALYAIIAMCPSDPNLRLTLKMDHALQQDDWQRAAQLAIDFADEPTQLNTLLADIATLRCGTMPQEMYHHRRGGAPYATARQLRILHEAGAPLICYHLGLTRYAYRWAMENAVDYGFSNDALMLMAKCSLLNGDTDLARKYLTMLQDRPLYRDWAKKYAEMADYPAKMHSDVEFASIMPLRPDTNSFTSDGGEFERYLWPYLSQRQATSGSPLELTMVAAMMNQDLDRFMALTDIYLQKHKTLPQHFQEAVVVWLNISDASPDRQYPIDPVVAQRFENFLTRFQRVDGQPKELIDQAIYADYGDTYWYYFVTRQFLPII